jgi:DNA-3-methyladenine glycosylase
VVPTAESLPLLSPLPVQFFARDALVVARALVGAFVVRGEQVARIVETEAYRGPTDAACHARVGLTKRTRTLLGDAGHAYVYLVYGMHECFNVVCGGGHAVLVRAGEIVRGGPARASGPGLFARAMGITRADDGADLTERGRGALFVAARASRPRVGVSARVGVAYAGEIAEAPWRFFDAESTHVSRPGARAIGLGVAASSRAPTATPTRRSAPSRSRRRT